MKKFYIPAVTLILLLVAAYALAGKEREENKINENDFKLNVTSTVHKPLVQPLNVVPLTVEEVPPQQEQPEDEEVNEESENDRPKFENPIPLPESTLDEIFEICEVNNLSYTLVLAIAQVESNFDPEARSGTGDFGLMQINKNSQQWLADMAGLEKVHPFDPSQSVLMAAEYLLYLRDYFDEFDLSEEDKFNYVVGGYNAGHVGIQRYAKKHDVANHPYVLKVLEAKSKLEQEMIIE